MTRTVMSQPPQSLRQASIGGWGHPSHYREQLRWIEASGIGPRAQMDSGHTESPNNEFRWGIDEEKTYTFWQANNSIHCAAALKEMITVWIVVLAHELDNLVWTSRVACRCNSPTGGKGNVRNRIDRTPLCMHRYMMSAKGFGSVTCLV